MSTKRQFWTNPDVGLLILRITVGGLLLLHGVHKISAGLDNADATPFRKWPAGSTHVFCICF